MLVSSQAYTLSLQILRGPSLLPSHHPPTPIHFTDEGISPEKLSELPEVTQCFGLGQLSWSSSLSPDPFLSPPGPLSKIPPLGHHLDSSSCPGPSLLTAKAWPLQRSHSIASDPRELPAFQT